MYKAYGGWTFAFTDYYNLNFTLMLGTRPADMEALIGLISSGDRDALAAGDPPTLGAAGRLPGVTPAGLLALLAHVRRKRQ